MSGIYAISDQALEPSVGGAAAKVLVVGEDSTRCCAYESMLEADQVHLVPSTSSEALRWLRSDDSFDLVVIDGATEHDGSLELCRQVKRDQRFCLLPVVILLHHDQGLQRQVALRWGADDCLTVPEQDDEFLQRCRNLIRTKQATDALENSEKVIFALARIIEGRDRYTQGHVERVSAYAVQLGRHMGLSDADVLALKKGGIVHDLGKIAVPDAVLNKPGPLDEEGEWEWIRQHPVAGYDLLAPLRTFGPVLPIVRWHHERPDGTGYPDGIGGEELPHLPRIVAVADCFDALTTTRPYREGMSMQTSLDILTEGAAQGQYDREVVSTLTALCSSGVAL